MNSKEKPYYQQTEKKKFTGITGYNKLRIRHIFVKNVIINLNLDTSKHYLTADIPGEK